MKATPVSMFRGDSQTFELTVTDSKGLPVDISGCSATFVVARTQSEAAEVTKRIGNGITLVDAPHGVMKVTLAPQDTTNLKGDYYYELELDYPDGSINTILFGTLSVIPDYRIGG